MKNAPVILLCGVETSLAEKIHLWCDKLNVKSINTEDEFMQQIDQITPFNTEIICCGPAIKNVQPIELAQSLKLQLKGKKIFFVSTDNYSANDKDLIKNGFDQTFFMPLDAQHFEKSLKRLQAAALGESFESYLSVPIDEIKEHIPLQFDVMVLLPLNQKYIRLFKAGSVIQPEHIAKLKKQSANIVFINEQDEDKFRSYLQSKNVNLSGAESGFTRKERLHGKVRDIFHTMMAPSSGSFESGKQLLADAQNIVGGFIAKDSVSHVLDELFKQIGQESGDHYDQSIRVSTYSSLFSSILSVGKPEDLAVAGLFYHVGLAKCPESLLKKPTKDMTPEEKAIYYRHPENSVNMAKEKKIIMGPETVNAILYHHEKLDGSGHPKNLRSGKISGEAVVLALANDFDELTSMKTGRQMMSAHQALSQMQQSMSGEAEMVRRIQSTITPPTKKSA